MAEMMEQYGEMSHAPTYARRIVTMEHLIKLFFELATDTAFIPGLVMMARRGRHFEFFIGVFQLYTSFCYNLCDALDINFFLSHTQWHGLNNIMSVTLGSFVLIYLMGNRNEMRDHLLRYVSFAAIWLFQIKDGFWMERSQFTAVIPVLLAVMLLAKAAISPPGYNRPKLARGIGSTALGGVFFYASLQDKTDPYRALHGLAQCAIGAALYFFWQSIPINNYKKSDDPTLPVRRPPTRQIPTRNR